MELAAILADNAPLVNAQGVYLFLWVITKIKIVYTYEVQTFPHRRQIKFYNYYCNYKNPQ